MGVFKVVVFPILEDANCGKAHNPEGNCKPFSEVFRVPIVESLQQLSACLSALVGSAPA